MKTKIYPFARGSEVMHKQLYGLPEKIFYQLINVLQKYSLDIERVILFGSRARGDFQYTSDIDLAIKFRHNTNMYCEIVDQLTQMAEIYSVDVIDYDKIHNSKLKKYIDEESIIIFLTNDKGEMLVTMNKVIDKVNDFEKALVKLHQSLERDVHQDDIVLDATIQRFEFTYELAWKLMKKYLEYSGLTDISSLRATMRIAFQNQLIVDGEGWMAMLEDRNRISHTHDAETAMEIYRHIQDRYIHLFDELLIEMKKRL